MVLVVSSPTEIVCPSPTKAFEPIILQSYQSTIPDMKCNKKSSVFNFSDEATEVTSSPAVNFLSLPLSPKGFQLVSTEDEMSCENSFVFSFNPFEKRK